MFGTLSELLSLLRQPDPIQAKLMKEDIAIHGSVANGTYRGISWRMRRPYGTYWCGYVDGILEHPRRGVPKLIDIQSIDDELIDKMEEHAHGGFTSGMGFDCAHYDDYPIGSGTYKDYDYVLNCIYAIIDTYRGPFRALNKC